MVWFLIIVGVIAIGLFLYWLLVTTEGVYLGRRVVIWLYDVTAQKYDRIKQFDAADEQFLIAWPLQRALRNRPTPLILDVGTGTGRVPNTVLGEATFRGHIIGLDASGKMLAQAKPKLEAISGQAEGQAELVQQSAVPLPFPESTFDAVTCLEALEFFPSDTDALKEMARVLRPGGFLMTSRRRGREGKMFIGRYRSLQTFEAHLRDLGLVDVQSQLWETNYDMVTARKQ